ncbi:PREDICTED: protein FAM170A-like [Ceratotherium simum simum]|uniref:Protein FAM170A-like n=1 Tax=Ceratotherium simum simum TaxID=73337 RepID=A0ABM1D0L5_CERSS|nr:PREDICTED: protein FAM170A-like [Ceratotherium simum simum]
MGQRHLVSSQSLGAVPETSERLRQLQDSFQERLSARDRCATVPKAAESQKFGTKSESSIQERLRHHLRSGGGREIPPETILLVGLRPNRMNQRPSGRKRPFSKTAEASTQEDRATQPAASEKRSPSSRPRKTLRLSERSPSSASSERTSHSSSYGRPKEKPWVRCAYYTQVRTVKGVAVAWQTESTFAPVDEKPRVFEAELSQESTIGSPPSPADTESLLSDTEPCAQEPEARTRAPAVQEQEGPPRAATPECLVTSELGFRCVACCRVFPSREAVVAHAERGVKEGFSCRVFYEEMLERRRSPSAPRRPRRRHLLDQKLLVAAKSREVRAKEEACRRLQERLQARNQELRRLRRELARLQRQERRARLQGPRGTRWKGRAQAL